MAIVSFSGLGGNLVMPNAPVKSAALMIGGGGTIDCMAMDEWQQDLAAAGIASLSFDFAGVEHSPAIEQADSLLSRLEQSKLAYDFLAQEVGEVPIHLVGRSMGGPIALRLINLRQFKNLILVNPAAYSERAWTVNFGPEFTEVLRSGDWVDSPDFMVAQSAGDKFLVVFGDQEDIIPQPIARQYLEIGQERDGAILFEGVGHNKFLWGKNVADRAAQKELFQRSRQLFA